MNTTFGQSNVLAYNELSPALNLTDSNGGIALLRILQLIGVIAFVRGWVLLARSQGQGAQPGTMGKAVTHVFGGVLLMNIVATVNIMYNTLGIKF
jgi:intracellular multiplication protein IcmC